MTVTSRLWNILRARLGPRIGDGWRPQAPRWRPKAPRWDKRSRTEDSTRQHTDTHANGGRGRGDHDQADRGQDPDLARYYANLEVPYGSDLDTVEKAWKRQMRKYHPDRHATDPERQRVANKLTGQLNHAYNELRARLETKSS